MGSARDLLKGEIHFSNAINSSIEPLIWNLAKRAMVIVRFLRGLVTTTFNVVVVYYCVLLEEYLVLD